MERTTEAWSVLITLAAVAASGYLLAWRGRHSALRRAASLVVAMVSAVAAYFGTRAYAVPALSALHDPTARGEAVVLNVVIWAICLGAWFFAIKFAVVAFRKRPAA
jgi:hypothetical protein